MNMLLNIEERAIESTTHGGRRGCSLSTPCSLGALRRGQVFCAVKLPDSLYSQAGPEGIGLGLTQFLGLAGRFLLPTVATKQGNSSWLGGRGSATNL